MPKPGPRPKGSRKPFTLRAPIEHMALYEAQARKAGIPLGDYLVLSLAQAHDLAEPEYLHRDPNQNALPLGA